jgi:hypothetical protein
LIITDVSQHLAASIFRVVSEIQVPWDMRLQYVGKGRVRPLETVRKVEISIVPWIELRYSNPTLSLVITVTKISGSYSNTNIQQKHKASPPPH